MWQVVLFSLVCRRAPVSGTCTAMEGTAFKLSLRFSPHLLLDGTWHSQSLELFSQVASVTNIIFSKMAAARSRLRNVHFN